MDLKSETIGLAVALELPMVVVDVQRAGPSTGMPTKTEAADLLMALYGRHGESPLPIVAAPTPGKCFDAAHRGGADRGQVPHARDPAQPTRSWPTPPSRGGSPTLDDLPEIDPAFATETNHPDGFMPYMRDENLARPWAVPGTPGLRHRIGGLEKEDVTRQHLLRAREPRAHDPPARRADRERIARRHPRARGDDPDGAELLVLGWGSSYGAIEGAARRLRREHGTERRHRPPAPPQPAARATPATCWRYPSACWCRR